MLIANRDNQLNYLLFYVMFTWCLYTFNMQKYYLENILISLLFFNKTLSMLKLDIMGWSLTRQLSESKPISFAGSCVFYITDSPSTPT